MATSDLRQLISVHEVQVSEIVIQFATDMKIDFLIDYLF